MTESSYEHDKRLEMERKAARRAELEAEARELTKDRRKFAPKLNPAKRRFVLIILKNDWAGPEDVAKIFGLEAATVSKIGNLNSGAYKDIHEEYANLGREGFTKRFYDETLHEQFITGLRRIKNERKNYPQWINDPTGRYEIWRVEDDWFHALHEEGKEREYIKGPFPTYGDARHSLFQINGIEEPCGTQS
jgi:hypothetical protein